VLDGNEVMSPQDALDVTGPSDEGEDDEIIALPPMPAQPQLMKGKKVKKAKSMML
jgi:hypothetical protein